MFWFGLFVYCATHFATDKKCKKASIVKCILWSFAGYAKMICTNLKQKENQMLQLITSDTNINISANKYIKVYLALKLLL